MLNIHGKKLHVISVSLQRSTAAELSVALIDWRRQQREDKMRVRSAVYTMAVIVSSHLVCNALHICLYCRHNTVN